MKKNGWVVKLVALWILIYTGVPLYWCLRTSLLKKADLLVSPPNWFPVPTTFENYGNMLGMGSDGGMLSRLFQDAFINTVIVSLGTSALGCAISILAGYAFARFHFRGKNGLFWLIVGSMVLPAYSVMIPLYSLFTEIGLMDTHWGLILIYLSAFLPLGVWLMRNFFEEIPVEIEESAWLDGAGRLRTLFTLIPLAIPGLLAVAILTFLSAWSQYALPLVFAPYEAQPLTVFLSTLVGKTTIHYGMMAAGGMLSILPPMMVVLSLNRYLIGGMMQGFGK